MKDFLRKHKYGCMAFAIPFFFTLILCIGNGMYPIGKNCMLHIDMFHQYCPFFTEMGEKLKNGESLFYTWNLGLGSDYVSLYAYYLASPLNWLLLICPKALVIEFMELLILFKIGLSGLTTYKFLKYHYQEDGNNTMLLFSTAYALCGFVAAYSWDIMWMDTVALAPLVILGLEKLVKEKKVVLYTISLAVSVWANYYISIMLCIFLVFYFAWLFFTEAKGAKAKAMSVVRFGIYSLLAGGVSAVLILPEMAVLAYSGSSMGAGFPEKMTWYFNLLAEMARMCAVTPSYTTGSDHWPNLYCGVFCLLLAILYAFNKRISLKRKLPAYALVIFFMLSFANNYLDFIWHGFHFPEGLPGRQSYLFAFLLIIMGYGAWKEKEAYKTWHVLAALALTLGLFALSIVFGGTKITELWSYGVTILFVLLYVLLYFLMKKDRLVMLTYVVVLGELIANMAVAGIGMTSRVNYTQHNLDYEALIEETRQLEGDNFYRVEDVERLTKNDSSYHTYSSATIFSSLMNSGVSHLYQNLYMEGGKNYYCFNGATPLTSAMFGVKYIISKDELSTGAYRTEIAHSGSLYLYENTYSLSMGYMMPDSVINNWISTDDVNGTRIKNLNSLTDLLGSKSDYISKVNIESKAVGGSTSFKITKDGYYYAGYVNNDCDKLYMTSSKGYKRTFSKASHRYLLELGQCEKGEEITITNQDGDLVEFNLYEINQDAFLDAYESLAKEQFEVSSYTSSTVEGSITTETGGRLVLSIPYVPGWSLKVDGKKTDYTSFCDALIAVDLEAGTHTIELAYHTPNLVAGAVISALCILVFLLLLVARRFLYGKENQCGDSLL